MYSRNINIVIQSSDTKIEDSLRSCLNNDEFKITLSTCMDIDKQVCDNNSVYIIDLDRVNGYSFSLDLCKALVVLASRESAIPAQMLAKADELWCNIDDEAVLKFYVEKLLKRLQAEKQAFMVEKYLDTLIDNVPDLIWFKALDGEHIKVNDAFSKAVGKDKKNIEGYNHYEIWDIPKEVYERSDYVCLNTDDIIIETHLPEAFDEKVFTKAGMRQLVTYKAPLFDEYNKLVGTVGCAHDVTELKNINTEMGTILDSLPFAILVKDEQGVVIDANEKFMEILNPDNKTLLGKNYTFEEYLSKHEYSYRENVEENEVSIFKNGQEQILSIQREPLYDFFQNPLGVLYIYQDITLEKTVQKKMHELAYTDQLTGLYQRRYLYEWSDDADISSLSLLYIDLDNFKYINDNYGHIAGDKALHIFARTLKEVFPDNIVARIGGDEFVVIVEQQSSQEELAKLAEGLLDKLSAIFSQYKSTKLLSASIGIACASPENTSFDALIKRADLALYESKHIGKNCYMFADNCK